MGQLIMDWWVNTQPEGLSTHRGHPNSSLLDSLHLCTGGWDNKWSLEDHFRKGPARAQGAGSTEQAGLVEQERIGVKSEESPL